MSPQDIGGGGEEIIQATPTSGIRGYIHSIPGYHPQHRTRKIKRTN